MNILKGIGAVIAGMIFIIITHTGTDFVLQSLGIFTPTTQRFDTTWMVVTATGLRVADNRATARSPHAVAMVFGAGVLNNSLLTIRYFIKLRF